MRRIMHRVFRLPCETMASNSYKSAGVDIAAGNALVDAIKPLAKATARPGLLGGLGQFAGVFDPKMAGFHDPLLLAATDGVGTKLRVAIDTGNHQGVGIDLVAMCVNDLIVQGAEPLFFLDYFATGKLDKAIAEQVIAGIAEGCRQANCALLGGETAEMPGMYEAGDYDLAGFAVGAVERDALVTGETISSGDVIIGLTASGVHSNGFSLVRKLVKDADLRWDMPCPFAESETLGDALLTPTRLYVRPVLSALRTGHVRGMAHITGGGLIENLPRVLPDGLTAQLDAGAWPMPPVFAWLARTGGLSAEEMATVFNCGIGYVLICSAEHRDGVSAALREAGESPLEIGEIAEGGRVQIHGLSTALS